MSHYDWEAGTLKLPTAEYARVKRFVQDTAKAYSDQKYAHAQVFWKTLPASVKKDQLKYRKRLHAFVYGNRVGQYDYDPKLPTSNGLGDDEEGGFGEELYYLLSSMFRKSDDGEVAARRVNKTDLKPVTNQTLEYVCGEGYMRFDPKAHTVHWEVAENNHARDRGRNHPIAQALFQVLDTVKWTRGSGGTIVGNDEYNRDSRDSGGGGNYVIDEYGPKIDRRPRTYPGSRNANYRW